MNFGELKLGSIMIMIDSDLLLNNWTPYHVISHGLTYHSFPIGSI